MVLQTACRYVVIWLRYTCLKYRIFDAIFPKLKISDIPGYCSKPTIVGEQLVKENHA